MCKKWLSAGIKLGFHAGSDNHPSNLVLKVCRLIRHSLSTSRHSFPVQLNDYEPRKGKKIGVTISFNNHRLFVGNIPKNRDREELIEEFTKHARKGHWGKSSGAHVSARLRSCNEFIWLHNKSADVCTHLHLKQSLCPQAVCRCKQTHFLGFSNN